MKKTNTLRILDNLKIPYELLEYVVDESDLSAENVARKVGYPLQQVYKTLVVQGDKTGILVVCIPGEAELDLKATAALSGNKKVSMVHLKKIKTLTGYIRGGVSPIGMKKNYPTYIDVNVFKFPYILVSAGIRGLQLKINPYHLSKVLPLIPGKLTSS